MGKRIKRHYILGIGAIVAVVAYLIFYIFGGPKQREILGCWVTDSSGIEKGFQCGSDGIAAPVRNPDKQYTSWSIKGKNLILNGKQFNDFNIIPFSDTLRIRQLNKSTLLVEHNGQKTHYHKIR